ncbi:sigma-70 family RNA polymerase sigma factor [Acidipropionibacterium jensenii]|uniref:sigma-70 family RNA polymerase sigma factor n=1 Tax=Acidipropionibacterium jensenii TaxID=1749 RepID=UPI002649E30C|nr:sigma-70 family RNA polymerase sigma factor [Acidipropionibacterium jensenii]MDN5977642.1 sigma-70 family RNA polymerase sigma factor [Acidipropionibacterium jensenii]MDN5996582.1 sigma-70 family RNA polymerase sigma factor [Acidipropionibacterium jensenii]MDN6021532.1 sigma-70 family RNA polymerase sigma factor [Acidipropionibacterium jensenii]MDN6426349.1 sigma-70 family RNA polymerase sigma factor [Acidipropionibacterium jensenii]MDN6441275.1 sigma-70 family RNA polymerase sigma factor [
MNFAEFISRAGSGRLTAGQQHRLFLMMEAGLVAQAVRHGDLVVATDATTGELDRLIEEGRRAHERLWQSNLPLALRIAGETGRSRAVASEDLIQAACVGLAEALMRFDPRRGLKFSTYAWPAIRRRVAEELMGGDSSRPVWRRRTECAVDRREMALTMELGRPPGDADIATDLGVDVAWVRDRRGRRGDVPIGEAWLLEQLMPRGDAAEPDEHWLTEARRQLPQLQRRIIDAHFGLGGRAVPRHRLAAELGISDRAVRRMELRALELMRDLAARHREES